MRWSCSRWRRSRPTGSVGGVVAGVIAAMLVAGAGGVGYGLGRSVDDGATSAAPARSRARRRRRCAPPRPTRFLLRPRNRRPRNRGSARPDRRCRSPATAPPRSAPRRVASGRVGLGVGWLRMVDVRRRTVADVVRAHDRRWSHGAGPAGPAVGAAALRVAGRCGRLDAGAVVLRVGPATDRAGGRRDHRRGRRRLVARAVQGPRRVVDPDGRSGRPAAVGRRRAGSGRHHERSSVTFADGSADRAEPQNGVAVLVVPAGERRPGASRGRVRRPGVHRHLRGRRGACRVVCGRRQQLGRPRVPGFLQPASAGVARAGRAACRPRRRARPRSST